MTGDRAEVTRANTAVERVPSRQVRAAFDDERVVVYQAYSPAVAEPALAAKRFVPPFNLQRMTWVKPSFLWMMYRSGWATKPGQDRVLAITIKRKGFEWALAHSSLSQHDPAVYASYDEWIDLKRTTSVRIQWDPERSLLLEPLGHRTIQIGLSGEAARCYVNEWTEDITDITALVRDIHTLVIAGHLVAASEKLPAERLYPVSDELRAVIGAT